MIEKEKDRVANIESSFVREAPRLAIVVPCYNEEEALPISVPALLAELEGLEGRGLAAPGSRLVLVLASGDFDYQQSGVVSQ